MLINLFSSGNVSFLDILLCTGGCLVLGAIIAAVCRYRNNYSKHFIITLFLLPSLVQAVIFLVNGNLGVGLAVAGAFSLVRFRSAPGNSNEIACIFFATVVGIAAGMGFLVYSFFLVVVIGSVMLLLNFIKFGEPNGKMKTLRILIPEDLEYVNAFDDIFKEFCNSHNLHKVRTTNLGGLYELQYNISLINVDMEKNMLDKLRQRNGNLSVSSSRPALIKDEL